MNRIFLRIATTAVTAGILMLPLLAQPTVPGGKGNTPPRPGGIRTQGPIGTSPRMGFRSGGSGAFMLRDPKIQTELKVTASQKKSLDAIFKSMPGRNPGQGGPRPEINGKATTKPRSEGMQDYEKREKQIMALLSAAQKTRLKQLQCQRSGPMILMSDEFGKQIGLTASQKTQITKNLQAFWEKNVPKPKPGGKPTTTDRSKMEQMRTQSNAQITKVLTPAQLAKWGQMKGKPFKF